MDAGLQDAVDRFPLPLPLPVGFAWSTKTPWEYTQPDTVVEDGVLDGYVTSQWDCYWKVAALAAHDAGDQSTVDAAVDELLLEAKTPWAKTWGDDYAPAVQKYVIDAARAGDLTNIASEVGSGACEPFFEANPSYRR